VIVCSCNVLSEDQILASLRREDPARPRSAAQAYRCLGCAPRCGRCVQTVRAMVEQAHIEACKVGCAGCPGGDAYAHEQPQDISERNEHAAQNFLIAAE
jgi:bacterioferritin-associated ferredoxin